MLLIAFVIINGKSVADAHVISGRINVIAFKENKI